MLFNSMIRAQSYHFLHIHIFYELQVLHGCRQLVLVRLKVNSVKLTKSSLNLQYFQFNFHNKLILEDYDKFHGPYRVGYRRATRSYTE